MRLNILWKLILTIALPMLGIYVVLNLLEFQSLRNQALREVHDHVSNLAEVYARQFDGELTTIAQVARSTAEMLEIEPSLARNSALTILEKNIEQDPLIYGAALAFAPREENGRTVLHSPYVYRNAEGSFKQLDIGTDAYDYTTTSWYADPVRTRRDSWSEPYFDKGAGNILMSTFSAPIFDQDENVVAVTTVDLPLEALQDSMHLKQLENGHFIILSVEGKFISHPQPEKIMVDGIDQLLPDTGTPELDELREGMLAGQRGSLYMPTFIDSEPHWVAYAPIPATGWSFAAAFPESEVLAPIYADLTRDIIIVFIGLAVNIAAIIIISLLFTRPIRRLASAMHTVTLGNLEARVSGINSKDEFGDLASGFNEMVSNLRTNVEELASERAERQAVDRELDIAREIQASLLPGDEELPAENAGFELKAQNIPARHVAGDFYDYWMIDSNTLAFVIADVSGKGIPAAFFMGITRTALRNLAKREDRLEDLFATVNEHLEKNNDRSMFVTLFYGLLDTTTGRLRYVNAGHMSPIKIPRNGSIEPICPSTGTILGAIPEATWDAAEITLAPGDELVFYTDGVTEASTPEGTMLEEAGFVRFLEEHRDLEPAPLCQQVISFIDEYEGGEQGDDVTVLVLQRSDSTPSNA